MFVDSQYKKCLRFLKSNGWEYNKDVKYYEKDYCISVDISPKEIVIIDGNGEYMTVDTNYYTLIGILIELRQVSMNYISTYYLQKG